jgi:hypothetical protein
MTNNETQKLKFPPPLLLVTFILSAYNLYNYGTNILNLNCLVSIIGLAATVIYFLQKDFYKKLIYIWTFAQLITINRQFTDQTSGTLLSDSIFDLTQVYSLKFGFQLGLESGILFIDANVIAIVLIGLIKTLPKHLADSHNSLNQVETTE